MTKKSRFIEKLTSLTDAEKENVITFFNKYPVYENQIDWNSKLLLYQDFEKVFLLADNSRSSIKQKAKANPELLFKGYNCRIVHRDKSFVVVMPLDWECVVFMNSFKCGGEGAKWCIGDKKYFECWNSCIDYGSLFYLVYFFIKHPIFGRKLMLKYSIEDDYFYQYSQGDRIIDTFYPLFEKICRKDMESINKIALPRKKEYEECSVESLFSLLEGEINSSPNFVLVICSIILMKGNVENINRLIDIFNVNYKEYRKECLEGSYTNNCIHNINDNSKYKSTEYYDWEWDTEDLSRGELCELIVNKALMTFPYINNKQKFFNFFTFFITDTIDYYIFHPEKKYYKYLGVLPDYVFNKYAEMFINTFCKEVKTAKVLDELKIFFETVWLQTQHYKWIREYSI